MHPEGLLERSLRQMMSSKRVVLLSLFDLSEDHMIGMKRYVRGLLKDFPRERLKVVLVPRKGTQFLRSPLVLFILNDILITGWRAAVARFRSRNGLFIITSQHLAFATFLLPRKRTIIVCFDLIKRTSVDSTFSQLLTFVQRLIYLRMRKVKKVITLSEFVKNQLIQEIRVESQRIEAISPYLDRSIFFPMSLDQRREVRNRLGIGAKRKMLLYVGDEQPRKNLATLVNSLGILKVQGLDFLFLKVGHASRSEDRANLLAQLRSNGIDGITLIKDQSSDAELREFYNVSDLTVFPSLSEGFGLPPLESLACGTPVVVSGLTSLPEVVGQGGAYLSDPMDPNELADVILRLLRGDAEREAMARMGLQQAANFGRNYRPEKFVALFSTRSGS